ncbi:MAG: hypothetical protein ACR2OH_06640, partial [Microthrixaceae bacterium]
YLCAVEPGYASTLSPSSVRSMTVQGDGMGPSEIAAFERRSEHESAVTLRRWDDRAKVAGADTPDFDHFAQVLRRLASERS